MILKQLVHLLALAKERHFGRAAQAAGVSQPGLSASIRHLEDELGITIVQRGARFMGFTAEGELVLDSARRIQAEVDALNQQLADLQSGHAGNLRLGAVPTALPVISYLTSPFCAKFPNVKIAVLSIPSDEILTRIEEFNLDLGITYLDNEPLSDVIAHPLYREDYVLLAPAKGRLKGRTTITWAEAADLPLCLLTPDMQNRRIIDGVFRSVGKAPKPSVETNSIFNLCSHVRSGHWCSVVPRPLLYFFGQPPETRVIDLVEPHVSKTMGLILPERANPAPLARRFLEIARTIALDDRLGGGDAGWTKPRGL